MRILELRHASTEWKGRLTNISGKHLVKETACGHSSWPRIWAGENEAAAEGGTVSLWPSFTGDWDGTDGMRCVRASAASGDMGIVLDPSEKHYPPFASNVQATEKHCVLLLCWEWDRPLYTDWIYWKKKSLNHVRDGGQWSCSWAEDSTERHAGL